MKVIVNYDPATGEIKDRQDVYIASWPDLKYEPAKTQKPSLSTKSVLALKEGGFDTEDIIKMFESGVIE